ncbi:MAG: MFS transporter [Candidatus Tectomicrobia bacterium]|nr:MFS transporter [Candidatus Tectomicrobia bacterium]
MFQREFIVLFCATFAALFGLGVVVPLLPLYALDLGAGGMWLALMFSSFSVSRTLALPAFGRWSDRTRRKPFITWGLFASAGIGLAYALVDDLTEIVLLRFVQGVASAMVLPIAQAYVGDLTPRLREGRYMGAFNIAMFAGFGVGPMLGGYVKDAWSLQAAFALTGVLNLAAGLLVALALPARPLLVGAVEGAGRSLPLRLFWRVPTLRGFLLFRALAALGHGSLFSFLPILGRSSLGISSTRVGTVLTLELMLGTLLQVPCGWLADRFDRRLLMAVGIGIHTLSLVLIARSGTFTQLLISSLVLGLADALLLPTMAAITVEFGRDCGMGASQGMFMMAQSVGMVGSGFVGGALLNLLGVAWIYYAAGALGMLALWMFLVFSRLPMPEPERELLRAETVKASVASS